MPEISLHKPYPASAVAEWDYTTEVAVIGFGAAGACAAIEAADAGAQVMLFERNSGSGGASGLSGGEIYIGGSGGTDVQRAAGFEDSTEDFAAYLKAAGGPCADEAKCDLYAAEALNHFAWLKAQGVPYRGNYLPGKHIEPTDDSTLIWSGSEAAAPFCDLAKPAPRGHVIQHMGWGGGRPLVDILEASARAKGVEVVADARAVAQPEVAAALYTGVEKQFFTEPFSETAFCTEVPAFHQDWPPDLGHVACPVTLIHGEQDSNAPIETAMEYCAFYPDWRFVAWSDAGELMPPEWLRCGDASYAGGDVLGEALAHLERNRKHG